MHKQHATTQKPIKCAILTCSLSYLVVFQLRTVCRVCHSPLSPPAPMGCCCSGIENLCLDSIDSSTSGIVFEVGLLVYSFVAVAIIADEHLVVSLETLCVRWSIPEDVAGASFMAFGSAAPEMVINAISTLKAALSDGRGDDDRNATSSCACNDNNSCPGSDTALGVGAILGSGMIAFTVIPGCCALATSKPLELKRRPLARDICMYLIALVLLHTAIADGVIQTAESYMLVALYLVYLLVIMFASQAREYIRTKLYQLSPRRQKSFVIQASERLLQVEDAAAAAEAASGSAAAPGSVGMRSPALLARLAAQTVDGFALDDSAVVRGEGRPLARCLAAMQTAGALTLQPLKWLLALTCPECAHDAPGAARYPITLVASFLWVALFSTTIAAIVTRWGSMLRIPTATLGLCVIASECPLSAL